MAYSGTTTHYGLPKYVSTDKPSWLDTNDGFDAIDQALYAAAQAVDPTQIAQMQNDITALQTGKQNVLTFDATPTNGSVNPVTSGGIYTALQRESTSVNVVASDTYGVALTKLKSAIDATKVKGDSFIRIGGYVFKASYILGNISVFYRIGVTSDIIVQQMNIDACTFSTATPGSVIDATSNTVGADYVGTWTIYY